MLPTLATGGEDRARSPVYDEAIMRIANLLLRCRVEVL